MDKYGATFDEMVQKKKEKGVNDLKQKISTLCHSTTSTVTDVNHSTQPNPDVIGPLPSVLPDADVTSALNNSNIVLNVNPTRAKVSYTCNNSELTISHSIINGQCLPVTGNSSGFNIVIDNWDMRQEVKNMTSENQNVDIHWVNHNIVENRVSGNHPADDKPTKDIKDLQNKDLLPSMADHKALYDNYIIHIQRILVKRIPSFKCLVECVPKHIKHKHFEEMNQKSKKVIKTLSMVIILR